jgi:cell wall-associated NlpC family hydrolase
LTESLAAPIREVQALVGPGFSGPGPAAALQAAQTGISGIAENAEGTWKRAQADWTGTAADSADQFADTIAAAIGALAATAGDLAAHTEQADAAVARARERLQSILQTFEIRAAALESGMQAPQDAAELVDEARRALDEAIAVVEHLRTELAGRAQAVTAATTAPAAHPTSWPGGDWTPAGSTSGGSGWDTSGLGSAGMSGSTGRGTDSAAGLSGLGALASPAAHAVQTALKNHRQQDPGRFGAGESVTLPDGSTAAAPNKVAADAVRHALTQLGVPYVWGGTSPGVGLDCSGLTQWAYHAAGLDLPRLAQEQDVGAAVDRASLRPGDLAVWDGHVAMIVGNGLMIEAGDPVQLSPVRTTNLNQGFHGFFRPTA